MTTLRNPLRSNNVALRLVRHATGRYTTVLDVTQAYLTLHKQLTVMF